MAHLLKNPSVSALRVGVWFIAVGLFITPLVLVVSLALGGNQIPTLLEQGLSIATWNSLFTTALSALAAVIIGTVIAIAIDRTDIYGSSVLRLFLLSKKAQKSQSSSRIFQCARTWELQQPPQNLKTLNSWTKT